eukprot:SAG31_NODE_361_length_16995_cov_9.316229_3_plen_121_part_00
MTLSPVAEHGNRVISAGQAIAGTAVVGVVTVLSITGTCTGDDDGTVTPPTAPVACATNAGGTACRVVGGNCQFEVTALVLDSPQSLAAGDALVFTTPCAPNPASDACLVQGGKIFAIAHE